MNEAQKVIKYLAIAFAISIIVGIFSGIYQLGLIFDGFVSPRDDNEFPEELKETNYNEEITSLDIDIATSKLIILPGDELKVENNNKYITSKISRGRLIIKEKSHSLLNHKNNSELIIHLPDNISLNETSITTGAGSIEIAKLVTRELDLELGAGKITIENLTVEGEASIEGGAGQVNIEEAYINDLDLTVGVGEFNLNAILTGEADLDAGIGELNVNLLDSEDNYTIYAEKGIGSIKINGENVSSETTFGRGPNRVEIDGGIGSINVKFMS